MAAVWLRLRAEARSRWRVMLGLALLLAVMAGGATAAAVGARRTETAYPRFLERFRGYDVGIATAGHPRGEEAFALAGSLPQVDQVSRFSIYAGTVRAPSGRKASFPDVFFNAEHDRAPGLEKLIAGRMSDPNASDEAMATYAVAERLQIKPGDTVLLTLEDPADEAEPPPELQIRITGIIAIVGTFESSTGGGFPTTFLGTPAFHRRWDRFSFTGEDNLGIRLRRGNADVKPYIATLLRELERRGMQDVLDGPPQPVSAYTAGVQALNRVPAVALWLLCGFMAITTVAVFSQLFAREVRAGADDHPALRALGLSRGQFVAVSMMRSLLVVGVGAVLSAGVAILASPLTPVGLARIAEPDPGFTLAPVMLGSGVLATMSLAAVAALLPAWAAARRAGVTPHKDAAVGTKLPFIRDPRALPGLAVRAGFQMALDPGRGARAVPIRTAILGTTIAIGALAAALTFASSLDHLIGEPKLAGYTWDAGAIANGFEPASQRASIERIERSVREQMPWVKLWRGSVFASATVGGIDVGVYASDGPDPSIIVGRAPRGADEAAVDPRTLRSLSGHLGDEVEVAPLVEPGVAEPAVPMRVVGLFAVPRIAFQGSNPGQGIALTPEGFRRMNPTRDYADTVFVDFPSGTSLERGLDEFRAVVGDAAFTFVNRQQSATVGNVERISALPIVLAAIMGFLGVATLIHASTTTIWRRRRDLAILKTIGFVGRQVRAAIAWQSTALVAVALLVGLPAGVAAGRWGWRLFARQLQVVPVPAVSLAVVAAVAASAILVANLIAAFPARVAARTQPALVLRTE